MVSESKYFFSLRSDQPMRHQTPVAYDRPNTNQVTGVTHTQRRRKKIGSDTTSNEHLGMLVSSARPQFPQL